MTDYSIMIFELLMQSEHEVQSEIYALGLGV